jgi:hypothetical protein
VISLIVAMVLAAGTPPPAGCVPVRDARGAIKRDQKQVDLFKLANPCPARCKVYVREGSKFVIWKTCGRCEVDHVCPLACCGKDDPSNMVWLTVEENRAKGDDCIACQLPTPPPK